MIRGSHRFLVLFLSFLIFGFGSASAQRITSPYRFVNTSQEAGVFAGVIKGGSGSAGLGYEDGASYGARYSIRFSGPLSLDVEGMYFSSKYAVLDTTVTVTPGADSSYTKLGTANSSMVTALAQVRILLTGTRSWNRLQPFLLIGAGGAFETSKDKTAIEAAPLDARHKFGSSIAGSFGAGFELFPTDRLAIRVDGRNVLWKVEAPAALRLGRLGAKIPESEWVGNAALTAGVSFHF
jgi:hypothetical protein